MEQARRREGPGGLVLVESKTVGVAATADTVLWRLGQRPMPLSKYCIGMALMRPDLPGEPVEPGAAPVLRLGASAVGRSQGRGCAHAVRGSMVDGS